MAGSGSPQRPPGGDKMAAGPGPARAEPGEGQIPAPWGPNPGPIGAKDRPTRAVGTKLWL